MTKPATQDADSAREIAPETVERQVGRQLEDARKALRISIGDMAQSLRLSERQVLALETGDFAVLPGKTFVRGFVRNYARVARIDATPLLELLDTVGMSTPRLDLPESTHVAMPDQGRGISQNTLIVAAGVTLVVVAAALYFFQPDPITESQENQSFDSVQNTQAILPQPPLETMGDPPEASRGETATSAAITNPAAPLQPTTPPRPAANAPTPVVAPTAPTADNGRVHFTFGGESWVEVRDKNGKVLSSGQHPPGAQHEVSGAPPLTVIIGRASGVELRYQGQPVTLRPNADSDIARVVLP
jgi:cytoskeleton protein RodZ